MNIFYLDTVPAKAAEYHCDSHVVKMILETAQLLSTAHRVIDGDRYADDMGLYKATHKNHPSAIWVRESTENYMWAYQLLSCLGLEYGYRYGRVHATMRLLGALAQPPWALKEIAATPVRVAAPDQYKAISDPVEAYRQYYKHEKAHLHKWKNREVPPWILA